MISSLNGPVLRVGLDQVVVAVGGVGFDVRVTPETAARCRVGLEAKLMTTLVVREDSLTLYGFATDHEKDMFELLQTVTGVGPRLALTVLSVLEPDALSAALAHGDSATLTRVPGIGKKGAERLIIELRDKVGVVVGRATGGPTSVEHGRPASRHDDVVEALVNLGWTAKQATSAVEAVSENAPDDADIASLLRLALRHLGR